MLLSTVQISNCFCYFASMAMKLNWILKTLLKWNRNHLGADQIEPSRPTIALEIHGDHKTSPRRVIKHVGNENAKSLRERDEEFVPLLRFSLSWHNQICTASHSILAGIVMMWLTKETVKGVLRWIFHKGKHITWEHIYTWSHPHCHCKIY